MKSAIVVASLALGAQAQSECAAGYKLKKVLTGLTCKYDFNGPESCSTNCCEFDDKTCGGLQATCTGSTYDKITTGDADTVKKAADAWAATAATSTTAAQLCCTPKAKCSSKAYTCPAGQTYKAAPKLNVDCPKDVASCGATGNQCCTDDPKKCGGNAKTTAIKCTTGTAAVTSDDGWKATSIIGVDYQKSCCAPLPTCASTLFSCPAGYKRNKNAAGYSSHACPKLDPSSCAATTAWAVGGSTLACCIPDDKTCGGINAATAIQCGLGVFSKAKAGNQADKADSVAKCCEAKATCAVATCKAGTKKKANVDAQVCPGDAASCDSNTCCEPNKLTCGGNAGALSCAAGTYDPSTVVGALSKKNKPTQAAQDAWAIKATTATTLAKDCCVAQASCAAGPLGTTTPAIAAVTTTPVAPARLFAAHQAATATGAGVNNMVWLAAGGFIGMAVLTMVQKMRSSPARTVQRDGLE